MATTRISDVIVPEIFNPYVINRTTELSQLWQSGIIGAVPELAGKLTEGGVLVTMPFWEDLKGEDQVLEDGDGWQLETKKIQTGTDRATQLFRGDAWAASDLSAALAGDDPMRAIGNLVASYWVRKKQGILVSTLKGLFVGDGATLKESHVLDISVKTGTPTATNKIGAAPIVDALSKLGDAHRVLSGIVMHSVQYFELVKQNLIETVRDADGTVLYDQYLGKRVIQDDGMPTFGSGESRQYMTVLFGAGALGYAEGTPNMPTETDRDSLGGVDVLINRKHMLLHPRGVKWMENTVTKVTPSNAELAINANWQKVYDDKNIRMVALITN